MRCLVVETVNLRKHPPPVLLASVFEVKGDGRHYPVLFAGNALESRVDRVAEEVSTRSE